MQCPNCNATLVPNARFCPVCGTSLPATDASVPLPPGSDPDVSISQTATVSLEEGQVPLQFPPTRSSRPSPDAAPPVAGAHPAQFPPPQRQPQPWSATTQAAPPSQFARQPFSQPQMAPFGPQQQPVSTNAPLQQRTTRRIFPGGGLGCLIKIALVVVALVLVLTGTWLFALRPSLHSMAEDQMGKMLSSSMEKINPLATLLVPPGLPLPVSEDLIQQVLVLPPPSWFSIQDLQLKITPQNIQVSFQAHVAAFSFSCTIISVPKVVNGQVIVDKLTVDGPITMVITPDEMKAEVNSYLSKLRDRTHRPIAALTLADRYIWVTLGI